eukprot:CFRG6659T1
MIFNTVLALFVASNTVLAGEVLFRQDYTDGCGCDTSCKSGDAKAFPVGECQMINNHYYIAKSSDENSFQITQYADKSCVDEMSSVDVKEGDCLNDGTRLYSTTATQETKVHLSKRSEELKCTSEEKEWVYDSSQMNIDCGPSCEDVRCKDTDVECGKYGSVTDERCGLIVDKDDQESGKYDDQRCGVFHCCPTGPECMRQWRSPTDRSTVQLK